MFLLGCSSKARQKKNTNFSLFRAEPTLGWKRKRGAELQGQSLTQTGQAFSSHLFSEAQPPAANTAAEPPALPQPQPIQRWGASQPLLPRSSAPCGLASGSPASTHA